MRIVVVGGGVAGLYAAWHLARRHEVVLVEAEPRLGGHTDTHLIEVPGGDALAVDSGFIVFNRERYRLFSAWLDALGVASRASDMSFGVSCQASGLEYNATSLRRLFCQPGNLVSPRFLGMVRDMLRFYRAAPALLDTLDESQTLGEWLAGAPYGRAFGQDHLVPMAAALWSSPDGKILDFPIRYLLEFMRNHDMLRIAERPLWHTIRGGSRRYVDAALATFGGSIERGCAVRCVRRRAGGIEIDTERGRFAADQVVLACHADQALGLLEGPTPDEARRLGAFAYQVNDTVVHTDVSRMPCNRLAWASWNVRRDRERPGQAAISYWMNSLQGLPGPTQYIVSLNQTGQIDPDRILVRRRYRHPIYTPAARRAQLELPTINGADRIWFAGACWGFGFHEDAVRSARAVVDGLGLAGAEHAA